MRGSETTAVVRTTELSAVPEGVRRFYLVVRDGVQEDLWFETTEWANVAVKHRGWLDEYGGVFVGAILGLTTALLTLLFQEFLNFVKSLRGSSRKVRYILSRAATDFHSHWNDVPRQFELPNTLDCDEFHACVMQCVFKEEVLAAVQELKNLHRLWKLQGTEQRHLTELTTLMQRVQSLR